MLQSPLFWRLAASHVGLVLVTATLPALCGVTVGTAFVLAALTGTLVLAGRLAQHVQSLRAAAEAAPSKVLVQTPPSESAATTASPDARGDFLAVLNHEIRTPLNGIMGMTQLALQTPLSTEQREYLEIVQSSANFLLAIVSDLHDFYRIEAGTLQLARVPFALRAAVNEAIQLLSPRARQKGLSLKLGVAADVPDALEGDPDRLRQLLVNLGGNAIQFTERGEIVVQVSALQGDAIMRAAGTEFSSVLPSTFCLLHFEVSDTGIGIPADKQATLFQASSLSRAAPGLTGTGVGLAIARFLVERMGGRIWVESTVGRGSTFHFTAPFRRVDAEVERAPAAGIPSAASSSLHVLLVDADMVHQRLAVVLLEKLGHRVTAAGNGAEALASVQPSVGLVLLDTQRDGLQTALAIRGREEATGRHLPIIATLAYGTSFEREPWQAIGIDSYLTKPLQMQELARAIASVLEPPPGDYQL